MSKTYFQTISWKTVFLSTLNCLFWVYYTTSLDSRFWHKSSVIASWLDFICGCVVIDAILTHQNLSSWTTASNWPNFSQWILLYSQQQSECCLLWCISADQNALWEADGDKERKDEYEISNHHRAYSPISCWLCFLLGFCSQCTLLIRQLFSSYSESSIPAPVHPTLVPNSIPHKTAEIICTVMDYFPNKVRLVLYYRLFNISVPCPTPPLLFSVLIYLAYLYNPP